MAYDVWLLDDTGARTKLDTDDIDITTVFSVADIKDISARKDTLTKQVTFKGTKRNNTAFGSFFHLNKTTSTALVNKLYYNYNPLRPVDCIIYEESKLILKGDLKLLKVTKNAKGEKQYMAYITGKLIEFKGLIQDRLLTDIDFTDLKHRYYTGTIFNSAATSIEVYNETTNTFSTIPFNKGSGYVYPHIDYGVQSKDDTNGNIANTDVFRFEILNYRPAVYVNEVLKRIFEQSGFSYELKGSPAWLDTFKSLIVPNGDEKHQYMFSGFNMKFSKPFILTETQSGSFYDRHIGAKYITINNVVNPPADTVSPYVALYGTSDDILYTTRTFTSDASVGVVLSNLYNPYPNNCTMVVKFVEAPYATTDIVSTEWAAVAAKTFTIPANSTLPNQTINLSIGERTWVGGKNLAIIIMFVCPTGNFFQPLPTNVTFTVDFAEFNIPKDANTPFTAEISLNGLGNTTTNADIVAPKLPDNIKQLDFIKSVMSLFNLYAYTEKTEPKKIIFEKYDDYYALASPYNIKTSAITWSGKVDQSNLEIIPNLTISKNYLFTYKDDNDRLNVAYKKNHGEVYGTFRFTDAFGVTDTKKVELIFSPTPIFEPLGTKRLLPALYADDSGNKKQTKTNIRILYFNGLSPCERYTLQKDFVSTTGTIFSLPFVEFYNYPKATHYYFDSAGVPTDDLNFGRSKEYFFNYTADYLNANTAYDNYYIGQTTELTNPNISVLECEAYLNEIDITKLDLKTPVFIDLNEDGHAYFKVLNVEYLGKDSLSRLTLQKIYLGTER